MKSSELKTVSLSRITCENLVTLMMMQPSMIPLHQFKHDGLDTVHKHHDNLRQAKRDKRRLERKFRKSGLTVDKQQFELKCSEYNSLLEKNKTGRPQSAFQTF